MLFRRYHRWNSPQFHDTCIVYLHSLIRKEKGIYDIYVDFWTLYDIELFYASLHVDLGYNDASLLEFKSLKTSKRLVKDGYYQLNLSLLRNREVKVVDDSYLIALSYDMSEMPVPDNDGAELLQKNGITPFDMKVYEWYEWSGSCNYEYDFKLPSLGADLRVVVRDVGQANWNELWDGDNLCVVYDMGAPLYAKKSDVDCLVNKSVNVLNKDKPWLIISHWDLDHIHCLKAISHKRLENLFSGIICVNAMKSVLSHKIFEGLWLLTKGSVYCFPLIPKKSVKSNLLYFRCGNKDKSISIYQGEKNRNINYSGLSMFVKGKAASAIFTGDMKLLQAKKVYDQEISNGLETKQHILIVPHHGGDFTTVNRCYSLPCTEAIISVGSNNYGHPSRKMLKYLLSLTNGNIVRTDKVGDVIRKI